MHKKFRTSLGSAPIIVLLIIVIVAGSGLGAWTISKEIKKFSANKELKKADAVYETEMRGEIPSSCGFTMGWPTTALLNEDPSEWTYEENSVGSTSFRGTVPSELTNNGVLMATMLFKAKSEKFSGKDEFKFGQPGFVAYCVNNSKGWKLSDFLDYIKKLKSDQFAYEVSEDTTKYGELEFAYIQVKGILDGDFVNEPFYVGVVPSEGKYSRLVLLQPWKGADERVETDRQAIYNSFKNRELTSELAIKSTKNTTETSNANSANNTQAATPTCTQFKIYEGEFKSDKCYNAQDLQDLQYYVDRYNNAIFDINAAARGSQITCNGSDFFKEKCEEDKKRYEQGMKDKEKYEKKIKELIAKGK